MKTSKKIILSVAGLFLVLLPLCLMVLRQDLESLLEVSAAKNKYKTMDVYTFEGLDFSANCDVQIKQGKTCKVELYTENSTLTPRLENRNGTLFINVESKEASDTGSVFLKITAPTLRSLKAVRGSKIRLENFQSDSLNVVLENGVEFTSNNNQFKFVRFKTSGETSLEFTEKK